MIFKYDSNSLKPGIYKITNMKTGRVYVGQALRLKERWTCHASSLRSNKHQNGYMQTDYNKCMLNSADDDFMVFEIIELMEDSTKQERTAREQCYIDRNFSTGDMCYNLSRKAKDSNARKEATKVTSIRVEVDAYDKFTKKIEREGKTISAVLNKFMSEYVGSNGEAK